MTARPIIADLPPCHGALPAAAPARLAAAAAFAGLPARPFRRILLAECGTGVGLAALAAALAGTGAEVAGAASDPDDVAEARALLAEADLDAPVLEGPPGALPEGAPDPLDLVLLPWGWDLLDAAACARLAAGLAARLAPGGALLLIHDAPPGDWAEGALRQLLANRHAACGGPPSAAVAALRGMLPHCHALVRALPGWEAQVEALAALPDPLIERLWLAPRGPVWSMRRLGVWAAEASLSHLGPADPLRLVRGLDFTEAQQAGLDAAPDAWTAQETADLFANRRRRADLLLRAGGPAADPGAVRLRALPGADPGRLEVRGFLGAARLARAHHAPLLEAAARRDGGAPLAELAAELGRRPADLVETAAALIGAGALAPVPAEPAGAAARAACARLNAALLRRGAAARLASPGLGGPAAPARAPDPAEAPCAETLAEPVF